MDTQAQVHQLLWQHQRETEHKDLQIAQLSKELKQHITAETELQQTVRDFEKEIAVLKGNIQVRDRTIEQLKETNKQLKLASQTANEEREKAVSDFKEERKKMGNQLKHFGDKIIALSAMVDASSKGDGVKGDVVGGGGEEEIAAATNKLDSSAADSRNEPNNNNNNNNEGDDNREGDCSPKTDEDKLKAEMAALLEERQQLSFQLEEQNLKYKDVDAYIQWEIAMRMKTLNALCSNCVGKFGQETDESVVAFLRGNSLLGQAEESKNDSSFDGQTAAMSE